MSDNGRISLIFVFNLILYFLIGELNNSLSFLNLSAHLDVLVIIFFGLYIGRSLGLVYTVLLGMLANASHPAPPGTYVLAYMFIWVFFVWTQHRIRRQNSIHVRTVAVTGQVLLILVLSLVFGKGALTTGVFWHRTLFDLLFSALLVYVFVWPWCQVQRKFLSSLGWNLEAQLAHR